MLVATLGLRMVWTFDGSDRQIYAYSFLLFIGWNAIVQALLTTLAVGLPRRAAPAILTKEPTGG
jgi:hypothetical protein